MKVEIEYPKIVRIVYRQEKTDQDYGTCLWAYFDFDVKKWILSIQSDCGAYSYQWPEGKGETFLALCARISGEYLLDKFNVETVVDITQTLKNTRDCLRKMDFDDDKINEVMEDLELRLSDACLYDSSCESHAPLTQYILDKWDWDNELGIEDARNFVVERNTANQLCVAKIFVDYVQPKIREIMERGSERA